MTPRDPDYAAICHRAFDRQGLMATFGAHVTSVAPGTFEITAPIQAEVSQQHGYAHAGLTFAIGDSAAGFAAQTLLKPGQSVLTVEMKINLMAPAKGAFLVATGKVLRADRRVSSVEAEVHTDDGTLVAKLLGTMMVLDD